MSDAASAQTLRRGLVVLRLLTRVGPGGLRMSDICRQVDLSKATAVRLTRTLVDEGFVLHDRRSGRYRLGPEATAAGGPAQASLDLQRRAAPTLRALAEETEDTVFLSVPHGYETVCLSRDEGAFPIRNQLLNPGDHVPLGVGSAGVALLAEMADEDVAAVLAHTRAARAERYPGCTDAAIETLLAQTRADGWCVFPGLLLPDSWAVARAVRDRQGQAVAAVTVAAIRSRLLPERSAAIGRRLADVCAALGDASGMAAGAALAAGAGRGPVKPGAASGFAAAP